MLRLIELFRKQGVLACQSEVNFGWPLKVGQGLTQGGPLFLMLFNILVDAIIL